MIEEIASVYDAERAHLDAFWADRPQQEFEWTLGPIAQRMPRFRVRRVAPTDNEDPWVYVSVGAWEANAAELHGLEFILLSPEENPLHVELLAMVANLHSDPAYRLRLGSTVEIGRPWLQGSIADHLLVALPYPYGPRLEHCYSGDRHIRYMWLVPITAPEARLARTAGLEALESLMESSGVNIVQAWRPSIVSDP